MNYPVSRPIAFGIALAAPTAAVALTFAAQRLTGADLGLLLPFAGVLLATLLGGLWMGVLATTVGVAFIALVLIGPPGLDIALADQWRLLVFGAVGLLLSGLLESLQRARARIERVGEAERLSRLAEESMRTDLESILASIGDGIVVCDGQGRTRLMNQSAVELLGGRVSSYHDLLERFVVDSPARVHEELNAGDPRRSVELRLRARVAWVELSAFPVETAGEPDGRVIVLHDATGVQHRQLLRDAFLSLISHELRTPVTAIYGGASMLARSASLDAETRAEILEDVVGESERLTRLVDDLLVLARYEAGADVDSEPVLVQHVVPTVIAREQKAWPATAFEVEMSPGLPPVAGDPTGIEQVMRNLVSNAAKYSPPGSTVTVRVEADDLDVALRVLDRGKGLTQEESDRAFEAFYRSGPAIRMAGGSGVGLFVSRRLVEAMGGRIWAQPRQGGGTEVGFSLARWPTELEPEPGAADADDQLPGVEPEPVREPSVATAQVVEP